MARILTTISFLAFCAIIHTNDSPAQWITVRCPEEGVTVRIPRKVSTAYRVYGGRYESGYLSSVTALRSIASRKSSADSLKELSKQFRTYLREERSTIQVQVRKSVARLQKHPCEKSVREEFQYLLDTINLNAARLRTIVAACRDTSADLGALMKEYRRDEE